MKRILVIGERQRGLQRLIDLRATRPDWDGTAVSNRRDAEHALANDTYDAIITEIRSAHDDDLAFLESINQRHPDSARVVINNDRGAAARLQTLSSPLGIISGDSPVEAVANVVERSIDVSELIRDHGLKVLIEQIESLPPAPAVYTRLNGVLADQGSNAATVASIIEQDPSLVGEILKVVNSAYFGLSREITSVTQAVALLGFVMVRNLALSVSVFRSTSQARKLTTFQVEALQQHSLQTAKLAAKIMPDGERSDEAYLAGLLHDVGKLVFVMLNPDYVDDVAREARATGAPVHAIERELGGGVTHAEAGAYLLHLGNAVCGNRGRGVPPSSRYRPPGRVRHPRRSPRR
ncbi:MAG: response regulator [Thermomicrobiales bacterium]